MDKGTKEIAGKFPQIKFADYVFYLHSVDGIYKARVDGEVIFDSNNQVR